MPTDATIWQQFGVAGLFAIFAVLIVRMVLDHLSKKKGDDSHHREEHRIRHMDEAMERLQKIYVMQVDLHEWHKPDASGHQHWKNHTVVYAVERLSKTIEANTHALSRLAVILDRLETEHEA
jgi:hypothetical protein